MSIYGRPVHSLIRDMIEELAPKKGQTFSRKAAIAWFGKDYSKIKKGTISAHLIRFSTNALNRLHHSFKPDEDLLFKVDQSHFRLYDPTTDPPPIHSKPPDTIDAETDPAQTPSEFAYESDLRDFLAENRQSSSPASSCMKTTKALRGLSSLLATDALISSLSMIRNA